MFGIYAREYIRKNGPVTYQENSITKSKEDERQFTTPLKKMWEDLKENKKK